jgi:NADP-dependent 3-hydroxy acid dehydrogenase YdfG
LSARPLALITGASRGIGAETARVLAASHDLLLGGRDVAALEALAKELPGARPWPVELTDPTALAEATSGIDRLDVLVHSAGLARIAPLDGTSVDVWRQTMDVNVIAIAELTRLLLPALRAARGRVVFVNSGSGQRVLPNWVAYAASKFALRAYADGLRLEEAEHGLRVTTVFPGRTNTEMQREVRAAEGGEFQPDLYLQPTTVAKAIEYVVQAPPDAQIPELSVRPAP